MKKQPAIKLVQIVPVDDIRLYGQIVKKEIDLSLNAAAPSTRNPRNARLAQRHGLSDRAGETSWASPFFNVWPPDPKSRMARTDTTCLSLRRESSKGMGHIRFSDSNR
jgi:hypothetical protein